MEFHSLQSFNPRPELRSPLDDPLPSCRSRLRVPATPDGVASTAAAGGPRGTGLLAWQIRPVHGSVVALGGRSAPGPCSPVRVRSLAAPVV